MESDTARSGGLLVQKAWSGGCPRLKGHLEWRPHRAALLPDEGAGEGSVQEAGLQGAADARVLEEERRGNRCPSGTPLCFLSVICLFPSILGPSLLTQGLIDSPPPITSGQTFLRHPQCHLLPNTTLQTWAVILQCCLLSEERRYFVTCSSHI